jgi:histidyl-tRNA synthetase
MELYRKYGREYIVKRLGEFDPGLALALSENWDDSPAGLPGEVHDRTLVQFFGSMDVSDAKSVLLELLKNLEMPLEGHRSEEEIVGRLLVKLMHRDQTSRVSQALTFMGELSQLTGEPASTLAEAEKLLRAYDVDSSPLRELRATIEALQYYEHDRPQIRIDFGLSRGLQYYTGIIFEIHHQGAGDEIQLCGGGRYDDLIGSLGGPEGVPAMGFSYGVERLRLTLEQQGRLPSAAKAGTDVLVAPLTSEDYAYSVMVGEFLRRAGLRVEVDFKERSMKSKLKYSAKRSIPFTISVGPDERATSTVHLKDMLARTENRLSLDAAQAYIVNSRSDVGRQ